MIKPHGGKLIERTLDSARKKEALEQSKGWPKIKLNAESISDVENIAYGVYSPLEGFLGEKEFQSVLQSSRLPNDLPWTIPIVLDASADEAKGFKPGQDILLTDEAGTAVAVFHLQEKFGYDKEAMSQKVFGTTDPKHPGVAKIAGMKDVLLGGPIDLIQAPATEFARYYLTPKETRVLFKEKGWRTVVAFQTRNTPHVGHEYLQKAALTFTDGLFINRVIGKKKKGDYRDEVILASYEELMKHYYLRNRAVMAILKMEMRYAGPKEAIHHAILRKNFGCTHIIIGRDHAGVGKYYGPYDAQDIFDQFPDLGIAPLFFRSFYFCKKCNSVVNEKICPHGAEDQIQFSGTAIRDMMVKGEVPPVEMMRPEVAKVIIDFSHPFNE